MVAAHLLSFQCNVVNAHGVRSPKQSPQAAVLVPAHPSQQSSGCSTSFTCPSQTVRRQRGERFVAAAQSSNGASITPPWSVPDARLVLQDGSVWHGKGFGYLEGNNVGEVVFNTTLTGYQELLTDPSYKGQFICYTVPHIGNVGINTGQHLLLIFILATMLDTCRARG